MFKRMILMILAVLVVFGIVAAIKYYGITTMMAGMKAMDMRQTVSTAVATSQEWQASESVIGSLRAARGVDIAGEVAGVVEEIHFKSGDEAQAGELLVKLRADDDIARLHSLEATAKLAKITLERDRKQLKAEAVSQATVDNDTANLANYEAQVDEQRALVDKKFIRAPFPGRLGIRNIDLGQYLTAGTAIVTLQQLNPLYLDFTLPQQSLSQVRVKQKIEIRNDTYPNRTFDGQITAINPRVDPATRTLQIRASVPNDDSALLPGMYATASIRVGEPGQYVTVPQTAITYNPYGNTVYLVEKKGKDDKGEDKLTALQSFVTVGETRGDQVQILKGVKAGDIIVTSGQLKLQNGAGVIINNDVLPKADANPAPADQ